MPFVSITRARVYSWRHEPAFIFHALKSAFQARRAEGCQAIWLLREGRRTYWTRTVWHSEQAMRAYMGKGAHLEAMKRIGEWCDEASVVHWTQETSTPPTWHDAFKRMQRDGRPSRLKQPNDLHRRFQLSPLKLPLVFLRMRVK